MARVGLRFGTTTVLRQNESYALPARGGGLTCSSLNGLQVSMDEINWTNLNNAGDLTLLNGRFIRSTLVGTIISLIQG